MIVKDPDSKIGDRLAEETSRAGTSGGPPADQGLQGEPPPYSPPVGSSSVPGPLEPLPKATNFVSFFKVSGSLKGTWVINPTIPLPAPFLQPVDPTQAENVRKNLYLKTQNGTVTVDVTLVPTVSDEPSRAGQPPFVVFEAETFNGTVTFKLHELPPIHPITTRLPVQIRLSTYNGAIYVKIPRSFRGTIESQSWWGTTKLSESVKSQVSCERDEGRIKRLFIGEFDEMEFSESSWCGDQLNAETRYGHIYIRYEDEEDEKGFWTRLWEAIF